MLDRNDTSEARISTAPVRDGFAAHYAAVNARLMSGKPPAPKPVPPRPVSPFVRERQRVARTERMKQHMGEVRSPHKLFSAPIIEVDANGHPIDPERTPAWKRIAREVCLKHQVSMAELLSMRRSQFLCLARYEAFWRCREETTMSLPQIGYRFGGRDHTTVLHGIRRHEERMREAQRA